MGSKGHILVIGGAGFVGTNVALHLVKSGWTVTVMDNLARRGSEMNVARLETVHDIEFVHGDARSAEDLLSIKVPYAVLVCNAQTTAVDGFRNPAYDFSNNVTAVVNTLEFCRQRGSGIIFWSTNKVYGGAVCNSVPIIENDTRLVWQCDVGFSMRGWSPLGFDEALDLNGGDHTVYGATKLAADLLCQDWSRAFGIPCIVNRFSCLAGPNQFGKATQGWIAWFAIAKTFGLPIEIAGFGGKQVRDVLHIRDVCDLIEIELDSLESHRGSFYNVGGGIERSLSLIELNNMMNEMLGVRSLTKKFTRVDKSPRPNDQAIFIANTTKIGHDLRWSPKVSLVECVSSIIDWVDHDKKILERIYRR